MQQIIFNVLKLNSLVSGSLVNFSRRTLCMMNKAQLDNTDQPIVLVDDNDNGIRRIRLNHAKKRNALSSNMIEELNRYISIESEWNNGTKLLRALVISSNVSNIFSSGHDLKELANHIDPVYRRKIFAEFSRLILNIRNQSLPVICQVDGLAAAAGCQLAASCDIVLATEQSRFSTPGANVGLFCSTPGIALSRVANIRTAAYMVLTGRPITANEALNCGLVTNVFANAEQMNAETDLILESILNKSRSVIALGKKFFYHQISIDNLSDAYSQGSEVMVNNLSMKDGQEGLEAFIQKRPPKWTHSDDRNC